MFLGVLGVLRRTPSFGERLDLKRRRRAAADLSGKKLEILLDPAQKAAQIRLALHVGRVARRKRRAVITKAEDALPLVQQCTGQPPLFVEGDAFRRQRNALDEPKPTMSSPRSTVRSPRASKPSIPARPERCSMAVDSNWTRRRAEPSWIDVRVRRS